jgi:hypothetical protein
MPSNLESLQSLVTTPAAVKWFRGLFARAHLEIVDTGERFTVTHTGGGAEVVPGFLPEHPNFVAPLTSENIANLRAVFADDRVDPYEEYRIVKFMLRPCLEAALKMPILHNEAVRRIVQVETHWQEALLDPQGNEDEQLTVLFVNDQWLVVPGYLGTPQRRLRLTAPQALEFQRRVFAADEKQSLTGWLDLATWYARWRDEVSVPV